jgi:hypothetical protein
MVLPIHNCTVSFQSEQIAEWSKTHPNERILEIDMPLSYGEMIRISRSCFYNFLFQELLMSNKTHQT